MLKEDLAQKAREDTIQRAKKYTLQIFNCVKHSVVVSREDVEHELEGYRGNEPLIRFTLQETVPAAFSISENRSVTVLSFAGYKNPGSGYIHGIMSQEESLCHASYLYNVLRDRMDYYDYNAEVGANRGYYSDRAIWTPKVRFFHEDKERLINVITCAAPQIPLIKRHRAYDPDKARQVYEERIEFVCAVAAKYPTDVLILGAFGCGFHANEEDQTGQFFKKYIGLLGDDVEVVFAVPNENKLDILKDYLQ